MKFNCCSSFLSVGAVVMAASSRLGVLMKLDKNQRKPRVFKASDLCPYYNRRVNATDNSGCFHIFSPLSKAVNFKAIICKRGRIIRLLVLFFHKKAACQNKHRLAGRDFFVKIYLRFCRRASVFLMGSIIEPTLISWLMAAMK